MIAFANAIKAVELGPVSGHALPGGKRGAALAGGGANQKEEPGDLRRFATANPNSR